MIDLEQGAVAKLIDAAAVALLWKVANGHGDAGECAAVAAFPPLVHLAQQVPFHKDEQGTVFSVVGTWRCDNLRDYLQSAPGTSLPTGRHRPPWLCTPGLDGAFPAPLPSATAWTDQTLRPHGFRPADDALFGADDNYLAGLASWFRQAASRSAAEDREADSAQAAARFTEAWLASARGGALQRLNAFELEMRARKMGMTAGDAFATRFGWSHPLIGMDALRALNRALAWWSCATLMPQPFRLGLVDRCLARPSLTGLFLAANAAMPNLARAAAQRARSPAALPTEGVRYVHPASTEPAGDIAVHKLVKALHGVPVFAPIPGHPRRLCEMLLPTRLERMARPAMFRHPSHLALRRDQRCLHSVVVRIGDPADEAGEERSVIDVFFLSDGPTVGDLAVDKTAAESGLRRVLGQLRRAAAG